MADRNETILNIVTKDGSGLDLWEKTKTNILFKSILFLYNDVIMNAMASQITSLTIVYLIVYSGADQRKHQSFALLDFVRGIHRWPVNPPHKWPVTRKSFPFDDVIMCRKSRFIPLGSPIKVHNTLSLISSYRLFHFWKVLSDWWFELVSPRLSFID